MTVPRTARDSVMDGDFWPEGVSVRFFSSMIMATNMDTGTNVTHLLSDSMVSYNCSGYNNSSA